MSEPARSLPPHDAGRPAPGPLRDWLAAMRAHAAAAAAIEPAPQAGPSEAGAPEATLPEASQPDAFAPHALAPDTSTPDATVPEILAYEIRPTATRPESAWSPRVVQAEQAAPAEDADVAALMAENLTLKARLQIEADRQSELQDLLAAEIRALHHHVQEEMRVLETVRVERDQLRAERDTLQAECEASEVERANLREERDLWQARSEALAQPLFQLDRR